jgi:hypothetical protein
LLCTVQYLPSTTSGSESHQKFIHPKILQ